MAGRGMAFLAVGFATGIVAAVYVPWVTCALVAAGAALAGVFLARRYPKSTLLLTAAAFAAGAARYSIGREIAPDDISRFAYQVSAFEGAVASDPDGDSEKTRMEIRVDRAIVAGHWMSVTGKVMVTVYAGPQAQMPRLDYGDCARIIARVYAPMESTNPGQFSWRDYLARKGIYTCASVRHEYQARLLRGNGGSALVRTALAMKRGLTRGIQRIHPRQEASVIVGMVLGTYAYLPAETFRNFSRTGTLHLLAASGYNCYILLFLATPLLRAIRVMPRYTNILVIALIVIYVMMVGAKPSLMRAAVMASLALLAVPLRRTPDMANTFFVAGLVLLAVNPSELFDVGFQLSFLAVWSLIAVSPIIATMFRRAGLMGHDARRMRTTRERVLRKLAGAVGGTAVATIAVSLVTAPVVAYYFNYVSLVSIPANAALEIGEPVVFAVGFLSPLAAPVHLLGVIVGWVGTWTMRAMLATVDYFGSMTYSAVSVASPGILAIAGYYIMLFGVVSYARARYAEQ